MNRFRIRFNNIFPLSCLVLLASLWSFSGCSSIGNITVDNPVLGPPPPRLTAENAGKSLPSKAPTVTKLEAKNPNLQLINAGRDELQKIGEDAQVVATVNGEPIFAIDVLEPYNLGLERALEAVEQGKLPENVFEEQKQELLKKGLKGQIERKLLVQGLKKTLKSEQLEMIDQFLEQAFAQESQRLMAKENIGTIHELDQYLRQNGTSLSSYRRAFESQMLAAEYMRAKRGNPPKLNREELREYYNERIADYTQPKRVKWRILVVEYNKHGGKQDAWAVLNKAVKELKQGKEFTAVVKKFSDSPTKYNGGLWGDGAWTEPGSLSNEKMERALFEIPVGEISQPFMTDTSFTIVKVVERKDSTVTPFEEVQKTIEQTIVREKQQESTKKVLDELYDSAVIEDIFDYEGSLVEQTTESPFSGKLFH